MALLAAVAPLWACRHLPLVDLPQHLYLLDVLHHLHDPATVYPRFFAPRAGWTYVGYYELLRPLTLVLPVEAANRLFLSACVAGLPLALAFLLRSLGRPTWPALLTVFLGYGDAFGWGFLNYCAALPLTILSLGLFVRTLTDPPRRAPWAVLFALVSCGVIAFHPVPLALLALALPFLLVTTRVPEDEPRQGIATPTGARLGARLPALAATLPAAALALAWIVSQAARARAAGPLRSLLVFPSRGENVGGFPGILADLFQDGSDRQGPVLAATIALAALAAWALGRLGRRRGRRAPGTFDLRPLGLTALALALYLLLPYHIKGSIYRLNVRFAPLAVALAAGLVPRLGLRTTRVFTWLAVLAGLAGAWTFTRGFRAFDREAHALDELAAQAGPRPVIMGLIFDRYSRVAQPPVFLHAAAVIARERGGIPNFTFAGEPQMPVRPRTAPPPPLPSEWHPEMFDYERQGRAYDHFLLRGIEPDSAFGERLRAELYVAGHRGDFWLVRRR